MNLEVLKNKTRNWGASIVGFADLEGLTPEKYSFLKSGVSIAVRLSNVIVDEIHTGPTLTYAHHYHVTNEILDSIATKTSAFFQSLGYQALPVPASQRVDDAELRGLISHKMVATRAALGWIGKSALLITTNYGPRVRLVSVLTDAPVRAATPISESRCGNCLLCVEVCPVKALKGKNWTINTSREDLIKVDICHEVTSQNKEKLGEKICGMCISVCPFGRQTLSTSISSE